MASRNKAGANAAPKPNRVGRAAAKPRGPSGTVVRAPGKAGPQVIESSGKRWSDEAEEIFLDCLATTCNVTTSARKVRFSTEAIYKRRRNDAGFAARWRDALAQGYARIEILLVETANDMLEGRAPDPDSPIPPITVRDAIAILKLHRASVHGEGRHPGTRPRPRSMEEVRESILRKLDALARARAAAA